MGASVLVDLSGWHEGGHYALPPSLSVHGTPPPPTLSLVGCIWIKLEHPQRSSAVPVCQLTAHLVHLSHGLLPVAVYCAIATV